jgi:hypothetical protein
VCIVLRQVRGINHLDEVELLRFRQRGQLDNGLMDSSKAETIPND